MKAIKFLLKLVLWLIVLVVVALLTLPLWFGPVVKAVAGKVAPKVAQIELAMDHLALNPYTARFELRGLRVGNPAGYAEKYAATVGDVVFDAEREGESVHGQVCAVVVLKKGGRTVRAWIDRKTGALLQAEEADGDRPLRRLWGTRLKKFGERWMANVLEVETIGSGHRTKITIEEMK